MNENDAKKQRLAKLAGVGVVAATVIVVAPLVYSLITGLIGLAVAGVIGTAIISFAPAVGMRFANWRLQAIKHEARENPIETMENSLAEQEAALQNYQKGLAIFSTSVKALERMSQETIAKYPARAREVNDRMQNMTVLLASRVAKYKAALEAFKAKRAAVDEAKHMWEIGVAFQKTSEAAGVASGNLLEQIKLDTAFDAVEKKVDMAFAELDMEVIELANNPSQNIEVTVMDELKLPVKRS